MISGKVLSYFLDEVFLDRAFNQIRWINFTTWP